MKSLKTIAGKVLLYFYAVQRMNYARLHDLVLDFQMRNLSGRNEKAPKLISRRSLFIKDLISLAGSDVDLYNALRYLEEKNFINMDYKPDKTCDEFSKFSVAADGIDIIEGILRGENEKKLFYKTFNMKLQKDTSVESLIKLKLGKKARNL